MSLLMHTDITAYNEQQNLDDQKLVNRLAKIIDQELINADSKIWHRHPVWFLNGNPIVGYSHQKKGWRLMFWSGADFDEKALNIIGKKFKDASIFYQSVEEVKEADLIRWLQKAQLIQWDYKNLIQRKGKLERLR